MYTNLLALIGRDTSLRRAAATNGGEYTGPCPLCRCGTDRFHVWPRTERWACLGPHAGRSGCDLGGDAIDYLRHRDGLTFREACARLGVDFTARSQARGGANRGGRTAPLPSPRPPSPAANSPGVAPLTPPNPRWQAHAGGHAARCAVELWRPAGAKALAYLHARGFCDETLQRHNIGFNPRHLAEDLAAWGLSAPEDPTARIYLPRGITIPWYIGGVVWRLNVRRPVTAAQLAAGAPKYLGPRGFANGLYNAGSLNPTTPVILVEGEFDALTVLQACGDAVAAVATGSTGGSRREEWISRLRQAPRVLVAFDHDANGAGDKAAAWWLHTLPNAVRWLPLAHDVNSTPQPLAVRRWVAQGLAHTGLHIHLERNA